MTTDRPSRPAGDESLRKMTEHYKEVNDRHEAALTLTDSHRLAVCRELRAYMVGGRGDLAADLQRYEDAAKRRLGR